MNSLSLGVTRAVQGKTREKKREGGGGRAGIAWRAAGEVSSPTPNIRDKKMDSYSQCYWQSPRDIGLPLLQKYCQSNLSVSLGREGRSEVCGASPARSTTGCSRAADGYTITQSHNLISEQLQQGTPFTDIHHRFSTEIWNIFFWPFFFLQRGMKLFSICIRIFPFLHTVFHLLIQLPNISCTSTISYVQLGTRVPQLPSLLQ